MLDIQQNIPLKNYTTFRIGGPAKYFVEVKSEEELVEALQYAKDNNLEFFILGGGSNVLVSDKGFDGLVIKFKVQSSKFPLKADQPLADKFQNSKLYCIECWAGNSLASLVNFSAENSLTNLEWAAGIPGTIGGAVRGNAGAFGGSMADIIKSVRVLKIPNSKPQIPNKSQITNYKLQDCKFGYRQSVFKENKNLIILSAVIKLEKEDKDEIQNKAKEIIKKRKQKHPMENSAGSFFKNPIVENKELVEEFERDQGIECKDNKLPAGWLIEQAGLQGKKIGGAMVSEKHANFIVNTGGATAEDVIMLACLVKQQVRDKLGIELKEEVQYIGFNC